MNATSEPGPGRQDIEAVLGFGLTDEQWSCVSAPLSPQVIVAGAGTGKTTVMAARVLWLVATGEVQPGGVLGLTFTRKAAGELADRTRSLLARWAQHSGGARPVEEPVILTYHAFAGRLLGEHGLRIGLEPGPRHLDEAAVLQLAFSLASQLGPLGGDRDLSGVELPGTVALAAMVVALDGELAEQSLDTASLKAFDSDLVARIGGQPRPTAAVTRIRDVSLIRSHLADLVERLRVMKAERGVDFSDQMRLGAQLLGGPAAAPVVRHLRATFGVVLLDEYQDTSIAQRTMLANLFAGHPVTAVGDPLQAIYGWRSASVANIDQFGEHFAGPSGHLAIAGSLSANRRSGDAILAAANHVASGLRQHHPAVAPLRAPAARPARVHAALLGTHLDERSWVAEQVAGLVRAGTPPEHIAILARVGAHLHPLAMVLAARGVPASIAGRESLTSNPLVGEVVRTLLVLADPLANDALVGLLAGPRWRIGPADLALLGDRARELAGSPGLASEVPQLLMALADPGDGPFSAQALARFRELADELTRLRKRADRGLVDLCLEVIEATGVELEAAFLPAAVGSRPLDQLIEMVAGFADADGRVGLGAFAASVSLSAELGSPRNLELDVVPGTVSLMTVHRAKGLEWPVVLLPGLVTGVFPNSKASPRWPTRAQVVPVELRDDRRVLPRLEDLSSAGLARYRADCQSHDRTGEDRLAYVAVTRARDQLIGSGHWWGPGVRMRGPSPYLLALHDHDTAGGRMPWAAPPAPGADGHPPENPLLAAPTEVDWPAGPARGLPAGGHVPGLTDAEAEDADVALAKVDRDIDLLVHQLRPRPARPTASLALPTALSASQAMDLLHDPREFALDLLRPMPRQPSRAAQLGTAFHRWVQSRLGQQLLIRPEDLPGAADDLQGDPELLRLQEAFEALPYAGLVPHALEEDFSLALAGQVVRGRIDAVFHHEVSAGRGRWEVVDWKTSRSDRADPVQLAIYRLAWARRVGVAPHEVAACFVHVLSGQVERPELPDSAELESLLVRAVAGVTGTGSPR